MSIVSGLTITEAIPLNSVGKNYSGLTLAGDSFRIGGINLIGIVTSAVEGHNLVVGHIFNQLEQLWVLAKEMLTSIGTAVVLVVLQLAIADFIHALDEHATLVFF